MANENSHVYDSDVRINSDIDDPTNNEANNRKKLSEHG